MLLSTDSIAYNMLSKGKLARGIVREAQARRYDVDFGASAEAYVQIDGEAIKVKQPRSVRIRRLGQVVVLLNGRAQQGPGAGKSQRSALSRRTALAPGLSAQGEENLSRKASLSFPREGEPVALPTAASAAQPRALQHRVSTTMSTSTVSKNSLLDLARARHQMGLDHSGYVSTATCVRSLSSSFRLFHRPFIFFFFVFFFAFVFSARRPSLHEVLTLASPSRASCALAPRPSPRAATTSCGWSSQVRLYCIVFSAHNLTRFP